MRLPAVNASRSPLPDFIAPCLATLVAAAPAGEDWVHEIKFDGYRFQVRIDGRDVRFLTRNGLDWTHRFGSLPALFQKLHRGQALIDGELVVEDGSGRSSFAALVEALKSERSQRFVFHCFDLLHLDGIDLMPLPLITRKGSLQDLLASVAPPQIRFSEHLSGDGARILAEACRLGLEGIISKQVDRPYRPGRHADWLKSKCIQLDEFVIAGYVLSNVSANAVGALVVGYFADERLTYAGRVGTGFTQRTASELLRKLQPLQTPPPAFAADLTGLQRKGVVWIEPVVVAQIEYRAWTADNLLRHAAFKGIREDKPARDVRRPR